MTKVNYIAKRITSLAYLVLLLSLSISCKKERDYKFLVKNNTNYRIDNIAFTGCGIMAKGMYVDPNSESQPFIISFNRLSCPVGRLLVNPAHLDIHLRKYSDSLGEHNYNSGSEIQIKDLLKNSTNIVQINLATNPYNSNDIFSIDIN
jgi:hypothetical protein